MKRLAAVTGKPLVRYLIIASFTGLLVGCGGGSGDDPTDGSGIDLGDIFDPDDVDGDGTLNADDDDFSPTDLDGDGIPNIDDDDVDGDGIINSLDDDYVPDDADGDGFTDPSASDPCGSERGTDSNSSTANWDDNCHIERSSQGGQFADSLYASGIQRVVYCSGYGDVSVYPTVVDFTDGEYGPASEAATQDYQSANGLTPDGIVGGQTWGALRDSIDCHFAAQAVIGICNAWGDVIVRDPDVDLFDIIQKCTDLLLNGFCERRKIPRTDDESDVAGNMTVEKLTLRN